MLGELILWNAAVKKVQYMSMTLDVSFTTYLRLFQGLCESGHAVRVSTCTCTVQALVTRTMVPGTRTTTLASRSRVQIVKIVMISHMYQHRLRTMEEVLNK